MEITFNERIFDGVTVRKSSKHPFWVAADGRVLGVKGFWLKPSKRDAYGYLGVNYIQPDKKRKSVNVHSMVAECWVENPTNLPKVDHADGNPTNNHYTNLRYVDARGNQQNRKEHRAKSCSSKYVGVHWSSGAKSWKAQIHISGKTKYLGLFATEAEGAKAYDSALMSIGLSPVNFPC